MKTHEELKKLHGRDYVEKFESGQSPMRLERLLPYLNLQSDMTVADFACGNGMLAAQAAPRVRQYVGVDFSPEFIDSARRRAQVLGLGNAEFACAEIAEFCRQNPSRFDAAFAMDFSEHVYDVEWAAILAAVRSALKQGGKFYLHTPNAGFFLEIMKRHNFIVRQFPEHIAVRTVRENAGLIEQAGFVVDRVRLLPHYNVLRCLHFLSWLPLLGHYFQARIFIEAHKP